MAQMISYIKSNIYASITKTHRKFLPNDKYRKFKMLLNAIFY